MVTDSLSHRMAEPNIDARVAMNRVRARGLHTLEFQDPRSLLLEYRRLGVSGNRFIRWGSGLISDLSTATTPLPHRAPHRSKRFSTNVALRCCAEPLAFSFRDGLLT